MTRSFSRGTWERMNSFPLLPIDPVLPDLLSALAKRGVAVLQAPPGSGKTTRVPLALMDHPDLPGREILVLEPRRLAARAAARRMAWMLGETVGERVGYRVRLDSKVGPNTRVTVLTEGLYLRRLREDPELSGVGAVLFDEIHERGVDGDLALALTLEVRSVLRPDLWLLPMSATLDVRPIADLLGDAPIIEGAGRAFPVEIRHLDPGPGRLEETIARVALETMAEETGSALVFLPGGAEIRRTQAALEARDVPANVIVAPLYGDLPSDEQDRAVAPAPDGKRKITLATPIAETSLTIEGVRIVIDSGLHRVPRFDPRGGMSRLVTQRISRASAEQRRGRAGRLEPGLCVRLWPEPEHRGLPLFSQPEILDTDLTPLVLELAVWGDGDGSDLRWLDTPPAAAVTRARGLLRELGALDDKGNVTKRGRSMAEFGVHPRLARMMLIGRELGFGGIAAKVAAVLSERDIARGVRDVDLTARIEALSGGRGFPVDRNTAQRARETARMWARQLGVPLDQGSPDRVGAAVALAYPDRIAKRRPGGQSSYLLSNGRGAVVAEEDRLATAPLLAIADLDGAGRDARVFLAAPITPDDIEELFADDIRDETLVEWDEREGAVKARRRRMLFSLPLEDKPLSDPPAEATRVAMEVGVRSLGVDRLPWSDGARRWRERVVFLRRVEGGDWPDVSDAGLTERLDEWLGPRLDGLTRRSHLEKIDLFDALTSLLTWDQRRRLEEEAPTHVLVPSGSRIPVDYSGEDPALEVRLQEMFGLADTPRIAGGRVPLALRLLSPARRPVQVTTDLAGFWAGSYKAVRADLRGRYPKHHWPEDPMEAEPTARAKPRK